MVKNFLNKIFQKENPPVIQSIDYKQLSIGWNADPVSPEVKVKIQDYGLLLEIGLNYFAFKDYKEGDRVEIFFKGCSKYTLNSCNDEGYYFGQYRIKPSQLPWGEFYEITGGADTNFPEPVVLSPEKENQKHFIFFFKDETFECLADNFSLTFKTV